MPTEMSAERLAEIRQREENATPGPWGVGNETIIALDVEQTSPGCCSYAVALARVTDDEDREDDLWRPDPDASRPEVGHADDDALFIAHARRDVPDLLAEVDRLREQVAAMAEDSAFLDALRTAGVDNWTGYDFACELAREASGG